MHVGDILDRSTRLISKKFYLISSTFVLFSTEIFFLQCVVSCLRELFHILIESRSLISFIQSS